MFSASRLQWAGVTVQGIALVLAAVGEWRVAFMAVNAAVVLWIRGSQKAR